MKQHLSHRPHQVSCRSARSMWKARLHDVLRELAANDGVCMVTFVPSFVSAAAARWDAEVAEAMAAARHDPRDLDARTAFVALWNGPARPRATVDDVVAHFEHVREVAGIEHIGIGGDYDGTIELPEGLEDVSTYPRLFDALLARSWSAADCEKLASRNVLRVLRAADDMAEPR